MSSSKTSQSTRVIEYLRSVVSGNDVDVGLELFSQNSVKECSKSGSNIQGVVSPDGESFYTISLRILSNSKVAPSCSCPLASENKSSWCEHAVAVLVQASELGFLSADGGFPDNSSDLVFHVTPSSGQDVASVIQSSSEDKRTSKKEHLLENPKVTICLDLSSDRLGVQVFFNDDLQEPGLFPDNRTCSSRALDNLFIDLLEDHGSWDESSNLWYVNSSRGISVILGLLREFKNIVRITDRQAVTLSDQKISAVMTINWLTHGAEIVMHWIMPDGKLRSRDSDIIGNDPFWVAIDNCIYPITDAGAKIACMFPTSSYMSLPRSQIGPVLEAIESGLYDKSLVRIKNPAEQPQSEVAHPTPVIEMHLKQTSFEHFTSSHANEIIASLEFDYPAPPSGKNLVYLPDRAKEQEVFDQLCSFGFEYRSEQKRFSLSENALLDLMQSGPEVLPAEWKVSGFEQIRRKMRFADLSINITLSAISTNGASVVADDNTDAAFESADWFDCQVNLCLNNSKVPLSTIFKSGPSDADRWIHLDSGAFAKVPGGDVLRLKAILGMLDPNFKLSNSIRCRLGTAQAMSLSRINDSQIVVSMDRSLREIARLLEDFDGIKSINPGKSFKGKLRPYQQDGVNWLNFLSQFQFGGILADEMGLGKTVQTLAYLLYAIAQQKKSKKKKKPILVVAPTSVVTNWWFEAKRFTPTLKVLLLQGPERRHSFSLIDDSDIVITSYALLRLDRYDLQKHQFGYLILDEAQMIKNHQAATTIAAKSLKADRRLALTGTPTENRPMELWSIIDFLMPGYLGSADFFRSYFERPILEGGAGVDVASLLRSRTRPFLLRRTKAEVEKDLPPKIESVLHVEMEESQRDLYNQIVNEVRPKVLQAVQEKGVAGASVSILAALLRLRQICNHPNSIESLRSVAGYESGKFNCLKDLLDEALAEGRKVLVFCQFKDMLALMKEHLDHAGVNYLYLDGATKERQPLIDKFNSDDNVRLFLISLKAGGLGLNLTAADMVVIYDPWWNPAVENQAIDRAHRIGQKKTVHVYRLVTVDSVEQKIMDLKRRKTEIVNALVGEAGMSTLKLTKADVETLLSPVERIGTLAEMEGRGEPA